MGREMMDITDERKVIENLQTRPFFCSDDCIELDNGYVIMKKQNMKKQEGKESERKQTV